jgi:hypothetical protein
MNIIVLTGIALKPKQIELPWGKPGIEFVIKVQPTKPGELDYFFKVIASEASSFKEQDTVLIEGYLDINQEELPNGNKNKKAVIYGKKIEVINTSYKAESSLDSMPF